MVKNGRTGDSKGWRSIWFTKLSHLVKDIETFSKLLKGRDIPVAKAAGLEFWPLCAIMCSGWGWEG